MALWLRALIALSEDLGFIPSTPWQLTTYNYSSGGPMPSSNLRGHQAHTWCTDTYM